MSKPLSLRVYEAMCPNDPIERDDPRRELIMDEMRFILNQNQPISKAAAVMFEWLPYRLRSYGESVTFISKARRVARELRGAK